MQSRTAPVPQAQQNLVRLEDLTLVRFWGDEVTPEIQAVIRKQYRQVLDAAHAGERRASPRRADYLAISGGGANGAFAAGVLTGWTKRGDRPAFEVVTGVSTGALAAPFAFLGPRYDAELKEVYTAYGDRDIMRSRGLLGVFSTGLNDNAQLRSIISKYMTERLLDEIATQYRLGRRLLIQTTNIDAQRPVIWDLSALSASDRPDRRELTINILLASAAIPAVFPPVRIKVQTPAGESYDELHVDGGVSAQLFFAPPNVRFGNFEREAFGRVRQRHLHVIRNGRLTPTYETTTERTIPLAKRAIETLVAYQGLADLYRLQAFARRGRAELSYVSIPQTFTQTPRSEFDKSYMLSLFEAGVQTGFAGEWKAEVSATLASGG
nr:patatin-like phospholipase family protein [Ensifer canadensis]